MNADIQQVRKLTIAGKTNRFGKSGFTLLELLVVIAIISILAAMLMPAISRAKNRASQVVDINNLKQQIITLHLYTTDNDDKLPWPNWEAGDSPNRPGWLYTQDATASGSDRYKVETGIFWPSLRAKKLYVCPMDRPDGWLSNRGQKISSYVMNGAVIGYDDMIYPPVRAMQMNPEDVALWETDERNSMNFNDGASYPYEAVSLRHNQGAICATFGSSVSYVKFATWDAQVADPNKNHLWCYPGSPDGRSLRNNLR